MTTPLRPHAGQLDADLARTVRRTAYMRQGFYVVVLLVALAGQVSGAVETLHIPLVAAIPAVAALELGGIVVLANADVRRRLGERANASRILSAAIAAGAVAFNWLAHADHLLGGFFAGMSALGYLVWLMHTENMRRDRLRSTGDLAWTTPAYEVVGHWLAHPWLTRRARALAKADPALGLYDSLANARAAVRRERREAAIAKVLHRKVRAAVDPTTAEIAVHVYDLAEIATRLADTADYAALTTLIAVDLEPSRLAAGRPEKRRGAAAEVVAEMVQADPTEPPADAMSLAEVTEPRQVAREVALPVPVPPPVPPTVVVMTPESAPVAAPRTARSSAPRRWSPALRRAIAHRRHGTAPQPAGQVASEVAQPAADKPANGRPAAAALPLKTRTQLLVQMLARPEKPQPAEVARVLGTDNLSHVSKTMREATNQEGATAVTRPGDTRPPNPTPPSRRAPAGELTDQEVQSADHARDTESAVPAQRPDTRRRPATRKPRAGGAAARGAAGPDGPEAAPQG
jgi:hypothetical protein